MRNKDVYLDYNATTPLHPILKGKISDLADFWANPSSVYENGRRARGQVEQAREKIAEYLKVHPLEIVFTSGGSESNSQAILGTYFYQQTHLKKNKFIFSSVEHSSVKKSMEFIKSLGAEVYEIPVSPDGFIDLDLYRQLVDEKTALVSVMYANNETGIIFPIKEMCQIAHEKQALFHCDMVQALGKKSIDLKELNLDFASFSSHKIYSLKGSGLLFMRKHKACSPLIYGGAQERRRRAGTENVLSISCLGLVFEKINEMILKQKELKILRDQFEINLVKDINDVMIVGKKANRLDNTSFLYIPEIDGESLLMNLDLESFSVSTGAACSSGSIQPSSTLTSMGFNALQAQSTLRVSLGMMTSQEEMQAFLFTLKKSILHLRKYYYGKMRNKL